MLKMSSTVFQHSVQRVNMKNILPAQKKERKKTLFVLTNPCLSEMLLVSLSLWKATGLAIHCSPVAGLSGWIYILLGISGSALPATIQRELWNL